MKPAAMTGGFVICWAAMLVLAQLAVRDGVGGVKFMSGRLLAAAVFGYLLVYRRGERRDAAAPKPDFRDWTMLTAAGILGVSVPAVLPALAQHAYAPSGADVALLASLPPLFVLAFTVARHRLNISGASVGLLSAAAILGSVLLLASWETPTSFSPFARFQREEFLFLLSSLSLAAYIVVAKRLLERLDVLTVTGWTLLIGALPVGLAGLVVAGPGRMLDVLATRWDLFVFSGLLGTGVGLFLLNGALREAPAVKVSSGILLAPLALTSLVFVDRWAGIWGYVPMYTTAVAAGALVTAAAVVLIWLFDMGDESQGSSAIGGSGGTVAESAESLDGTRGVPTLVGRFMEAPVSSRWPAVTAAVSVLLALVSLPFAVTLNSIAGELDSGKNFQAEWVTHAFSTVGGWMMLVAALIACRAAWRRTRLRDDRAAGQDSGPSSRLPLAELALAALAGLLLIAGSIGRNVRFVNWYSWIPAEIQHALGTEYTTLTERAVTNVPQLLSAGLTAAAVLGLIVAALKPYVWSGTLARGAAPEENTTHGKQAEQADLLSRR